MPRLQILLPIAILCAGLLLAPWSPLRSTPRPAREEVLASIPLPVLPPPSSRQSGSNAARGITQSWHEPESSQEFVETATGPDVPADVLLDGIPDHAHQLTYLLRWLHGTSVRAFEAAPLFGGDRMVDSTIFKEATPPKHQPLLTFNRPFRGYVEVDDAYLIKGQPAPSEAWLWLHLMQGMTARGFVYRTKDLRGDVVERTKRRGMGGFGGNWYTEAAAVENAIPSGPLLVGTPTPQGSLKFHQHPVQLTPGGPLDPEDRVWKIQSLQLVGLLKHDTPVVYEQHELVMYVQASQLKTRALNELETVSLEKLQAGTQRVAGWDEPHQRLQFMGAIRAKDRCLKCHEVEPGTLLGAFTYWIEETEHE